MYKIFTSKFQKNSKILAPLGDKALGPQNLASSAPEALYI